MQIYALSIYSEDQAKTLTFFNTLRFICKLFCYHVNILNARTMPRRSDRIEIYYALK